MARPHGLRVAPRPAGRRPPRTSTDYVQLLKADGATVVANLTGNLGAFWSPWAGAGNASMTVKLFSDNVADGTTGFVIDKLEYYANSNRFVMDLRMPGQIADQDAEAFYNWNRWYRNQDGRYLSPDPIGLEGGTASYLEYSNSTPLAMGDAKGLRPFRGDDRRQTVSGSEDAVVRRNLNCASFEYALSFNDILEPRNAGNFTWWFCINPALNPLLGISWAETFCAKKVDARLDSAGVTVEGTCWFLPGVEALWRYSGAEALPYEQVGGAITCRYCGCPNARIGQDGMLQCDL